MTGRGLIRLSDSSKFPGSLGPRDPRPPGGTVPWYAEGVTVRKVDANSTAVSVSNTTTETEIANLDLPALVLSTTGAARLSLTGTLDQNTAGNTTFRLKVADSASTGIVFATSGVSTTSSTSSHPWGMEFLFLGKQPSVNKSWGYVDVGVAAGGGSLTPSTYSSVGFSTMGFDETDAWTISITAQMSVASTALSVTRQAAVLEAIN